MTPASIGLASQPRILTPDQRVRVFVSSTLQELAQERQAAKEAVLALRLNPVMFELGARPHPPRELYRAYLGQSHIFIGIYWQRYGWVAPGENISGLEDEYLLSGNRPKLIYVKKAAEREAGLKNLLARIQQDDHASYKPFETVGELRPIIENDLALLLSEQFAMAYQEERPETSVPPQRALPLPATPLVGRDLELTKLRELLLQDEVRLVTLIGTGGIGKTRLALELARRLQSDFKDGTYFVALAAISDPGLVADTVARSLGVLEVEGRSAREGLKSTLRDKHLLLVLDNFEQLLPAAPLVSELLTVAPGLKVLATSRAPLNLSGEWEYPVPPLELPSSEDSLERVSEAEAVRLFVARAKAVKPEFVLTPENARVVAEITQRLDGLPLAIELAAARLRLLTAQALLERLGNRLKLLTGGPRDLPARQQTLRQTLDWSYNLLSEGEQRLFNCLGVFVGGFSLESVEAVLPNPEGLSVLDLLYSLVEKSLVKERGGMRFMLLETLREYALEKLLQGEEAPSLRGRHAAYFLALAEEAAEGLHGREQGNWLLRLEQEHANLRSAIDWDVAEGGLEGVARFGWALWYFWYVRGYTGEGLVWMEQALGTSPPPPVRARLLLVAAVMVGRQGEHGRCLALVEQCLPLLHDLADREGEALALTTRGYAAVGLGQLELARSALEESLTFYRALKKQWMVAYVFTSLGRLAASLGEYEKALELAEEALVCQQESGDPSIAAFALAALGAIRLLRAEPDLAATHFVQSLEVARTSENPNLLAASLEGLAGVAVFRNQHRRAAILWGAAQVLRETVSVPMLSLERGLYEPLLTSARDSLGEADFTAALAEGRAMTPEDVINNARSEVA